MYYLFHRFCFLDRYNPPSNQNVRRPAPADPRSGARGQKEPSRPSPGGRPGPSNARAEGGARGGPGARGGKGGGAGAAGGDGKKNANAKAGQPEEV